MTVGEVKRTEKGKQKKMHYALFLEMSKDSDSFEVLRCGWV